MSPTNGMSERKKVQPTRKPQRDTPRSRRRARRLTLRRMRWSRLERPGGRSRLTRRVRPLFSRGKQGQRGGRAEKESRRVSQLDGTNDGKQTTPEEQETHLASVNSSYTGSTGVSELICLPTCLEKSFCSRREQGSRKGRSTGREGAGGAGGRKVQQSASLPA